MSSAYGPGWHLPLAWMAWLATTDLRLWIYDQRALYGIMRFLHLASAAVFIGGIAMQEVRRLTTMTPVSGSAWGVRPLLNWSFALVLVTGAWLLLRDPLGIGLHTMFLPKLALVMLGAVYVRVIRLPAIMRPQRLAPRGMACLSIGLWLTVVGFSTWNHVERPANINAALRASSMGR